MARDPGRRILVCGGRDFSDFVLLEAALDRLHEEERVGTLIVGDAAGADTLALRWAKLHQVFTRVYRANWRVHGKAAGPIRNQEMLELGQPQLVVAFPGGDGTRDMIMRARAAGVRLVIIDPGSHADNLMEGSSR